MIKIEEIIIEYEGGNYEKAYTLFKEYRENTSERDNFDKFYSFKYIKTIYEAKIKHLENLDKEIQEDIIYIIKHLQPKDFYYKIVIFKIVDILEKKITVDWNKILIWLKKLDVTYLSSQKNCFEVQGKKVETFSELEKYFLKLTKAYEKIEDYENMYLMSKKALESITEFTNNSDVWLNRRLAIYYAKKENYQEAITLYKKILLVKKDWFIYREIGKLYEKIGENKEAYLSYFEAFAKTNDLSKISNLLYEICTLLDSNEDNLDIKRKFYILYLKNKKNVNKEDEEKKIKLSINDNDIEELDGEKYFRKLKREINEIKLSYQERKIGEVTTVNERFCFIKSEKDRYYCQIREFPKKVVPVIGLKVEFSIIESFDKKKNQLSYEAKDIKILGEK